MVLILFVTVLYCRTQDEEIQPTGEVLEKMILEKVSQELRDKNMVLMPNQALRVLYRVDSDDDKSDQPRELFLTSESSEEISENRIHESEIETDAVPLDEGQQRPPTIEFDDCREEERVDEISTNI